MTTLLEWIWNEIIDTFWLWNESMAKELQDIKKEIASEYINNIKKESPVIELIEDNVFEYLVNDWMVEDVFKDIFRWAWLSILLPESIDKLNSIKERLSSIKEVPTTDQLTSLKNEIISTGSLSTIDNTWNATPQGNTTSQENTTSSSNNTNTTTYTPQNQPTWSTQPQNHSESPDESKVSAEILNSEKEFIKEVYEKSISQIGVKYERWGTKPETWFDCSWLRNWAFKEVWIKFKSRMTAHGFSDANVNIQKKDVKVWDFMFWDKKPWTIKHNQIYHIEMVISQPYTKNWKTYVRTLWSSTDTKDDRWNYVGNGVRIREREMKDYRHYWRPTYYYQLALHEQTWNNSDLIAGTNTPTQNMRDNVLSS